MRAIILVVAWLNWCFGKFLLPHWIHLRKRKHILLSVEIFHLGLVIIFHCFTRLILIQVYLMPLCKRESYCLTTFLVVACALQWRDNECDGASNHRRFDCLLNRLIRCRSKKTSKLRVTGLCEGNSPVTGEFPAERVSNAENDSIRWRHHGALGMILCKHTELVNQNELMWSRTNNRWACFTNKVKLAKPSLGLGRR